MPEFTEEERDFVRGTADFFGVNHYSSHTVSASQFLTENVVPSKADDVNVGVSYPEEWLTAFGGSPVRVCQFLTELKDVLDCLVSPVNEQVLIWGIREIIVIIIVKERYQLC